MTRTPTLLVARPKPIRLESLLGYCLRLGEANGFLDLKWLRPMVAKCGNPLHPAIGNLTLITGHAADLLSLLNGPAPAALGQSGDWRLGLKITYWNHGHRRWCPQCLEENGYWKSEWLLSLQVACPTHQRLLHEACPACRHYVSYLHGALYCCPCGADLRQALPVPAHTRQLSIAAHLSRAFQRVVLRGKREHHAEYHPHPLLAPLHLAQLCDLLWVFGAYALHRPGVKPQKIANHGQITVIQPFIAMAMHVLEHWPRNFHRLLDDYTKPTDGQTVSLRIYLQEIHQALSRLLVHPELQFLRHEFEQHVHTRWRDKLILKDELRNGHPIMSGAEAAQRLKQPVRALQKLVEQGEIKGCKVVNAQGKTTWMVERASVELFAQSEHALLTMRDVESLLRITPNRIRLLAENSLLKAAPRPSDRAPWMFKHSDVNTFLERLNHSNLSITPESTSLISVWEITKRWMQGREAFLAVIRALMDGDLQVESRTPAETGIRALLVSREQFRNWHQQYRLSRGFFTVPEAAKHLKMDLNLLYQLISKELVHASPQQYGYEKKMLMGIDAEELERIDSSYVWGKKLGALLGLSEHSAAKALLHQGVQPICGPTIDNVECYFFRCSDVLAAFAEAHAFNRPESVL